MVIVVSTTTIELAVPDLGIKTQIKSRAALIKAFAAKISEKFVDLLRTGQRLSSTWYQRLSVYVPRTAQVGAAAALLATKAGYHAVVDSAAWLAHGARRTAGWLMRLVEHGWIAMGGLVSSAVGIFSEKAAARVDSFFCTVAQKGLTFARQADFVVGAGIEIARTTLKSTTVTRVTNIAATLVVLGALLSFVAPSLGSSLSGVPIAGAFVKGGLTGTWAAFKAIGLAMAIASGYEVFSQTILHTPDPAVTLPKTVKGFVDEVKSAGSTITQEPQSAPEPVVEPTIETPAEEPVIDATELAMAAVTQTAPEVLETAAKSEADLAFKEATAHIGSSKNKHRENKRR